MTQETIITNAQLILQDRVVTGTVCFRDGVITHVDEGTSNASHAIDAEGDFVAPGLIELHTDNLEKHLTPRPKVAWPHRAAIVAHDRELAGTGITTVFDAIRVGSIPSGARHRKYAREMADEILAMRAAGALRISHHIHLRGEVCSETLLEELDEFGPEDRVGIMSMMDHTPGQRQFSDLKKYKDYVCGKHGLKEQDFESYVAFLSKLQQKNGPVHEAAIVAAAERYGATLASHDDTTAQHVTTSHDHGVRLAEFPTTQEAADTCHELGIVTIMGGPNIVRGESHSGNVSALDLAKSDRLDILSSDYIPASLLMGAVQLGEVWNDMPRGFATVTSTPAQAVGLEDRGALSVGKRSDIIQFSLSSGVPIIKDTWLAGLQ